MNCGIEVLKRLNELTDEDLSEVIEACEKQVDSKGLSMAVLCDELSKVKPCLAIASVKLIRKTPYIAFIGSKNHGHYLLVERIDRKVLIFDPAGKYREISILHFYMIWSKTAIVFMV